MCFFTARAVWFIIPPAARLCKGVGAIRQEAVCAKISCIAALDSGGSGFPV